MFSGAFEAISNPASLARQLLSGFITVFIAAQVYLLCLHDSLRATPVLNKLDRLRVDLGLSNSAFLLAACLLLAVVSIMANRSLYRVSEGYILRSKLGWFERRHQLKFERLTNEARIASGARWAELKWTELDRHHVSFFDTWCLSVSGCSDWRSSERFPPAWWPLGSSPTLNDYPARSQWILPTRLGNIIRSAETYAYSQFRLDLLTFWEELVSVVPKEAIQGYEQAKITTDVLLNLRLAAVAFCAVFGIDGVFGSRSIISALVGAMVSIALAAGLGRAAEHSARNWHPPLRAIVHLGRKPLADSLGLTIPQSLQNERHMWDRLTGAVQYRSDAWWDEHDKDRTSRRSSLP